MVRRYVAPILRVGLFFLILLAPLLLAAISQGAETGGRSVVSLRGLVLAERPNDRWPSGPRLPASAPATVSDARDGKLLVEAVISGRAVRGWADAEAFVVLDGPDQSVASLVAGAKLLLAANDRPVLTAAYLREAVRRDASNAEAWVLLGRTGERIAASARVGEDGRPSSNAALAALWGVGLVAAPDGRSFRYDGEAYRRAIALGPSPELAEEARLRILIACGPAVDPKSPADLPAARQREKDLGEYLASFPASPRRYPFLVERSRLLLVLAEGHARRGAAEASQAARDAALEAASEASVVAPDPARKRNADRLIARLTKSFPRTLETEKPVASPAGYRAAVVVRGGKTLLTIARPDGREAIQPFPVRGADPATLAFDATGIRLAWDESPEPGRRRTRVLDLSRAVVVEPAALAEPELLAVSGVAAAPSAAADRYSTFLGFSPDGRHLLVVLEGFTADGTRIPRRHVLCDAEGKARPVFVERPFSAPGVVDWTRVTAEAAKLSG